MTAIANPALFIATADQGSISQKNRPTRQVAA